MKNLISCLIGILAVTSLSAQNLTPEVVASAGESFSNGSIYLEWTLGEIVTESFSDGGTLIVTQGFHQPDDQVTSIKDPVSTLGSIQVYPNPTTGSLLIEREKSGDLQLVLWDMKGSILIQETMSTTSGAIDLSHLPTGIYVLRMSDGQQGAESVRIQKQ